ncbi:MAG: 5-(carboxyamino)imidazole ribonucleotide synthase [Woeseiaceae bacterium]
MTRIGIIGAGQLGQMLGYAGQRLGLECVFLDPSERPPAATVGPVLKYSFDSEQGLAELAREVDVITYEFENVPVEAVRNLPEGTTVYPPVGALEFAQDRLAEKNLFQKLDIPVPGFRPVESADDLRTASKELGLPIVLKTRRLGYDGKGQRVVHEDSEIDAAVDELGAKDLIAEQWVPFDFEVSAIGARNASGKIAHYPLSRNEHRNGILHMSRAPGDYAALQQTATDYLERLMNELEYVGVLALELFVRDDALLANEFAPRVHNSGHWTIEGAQTSQFENHLRAILDMEPGPTDVTAPAGMLNLIGTMPEDREAFENPPCFLHDYGKEPRPGRKLGHVTVVATDPAERDQILEKLAKSLNP